VRAAVTQAVNAIEVTDRPPAEEPGPGHVLIRSEAVGLCGSDFHFLTGEIVVSEVHGPQFPRVQGHEVSGVIEALGPGCPDNLATGGRVAVWPLQACGECYPCSVGRPNVCPNFSLIGIHTDGGLQEHFTVPAAQVFPVGDQGPLTAAFAEPASIAVQAVERAKVSPGERVVILGAGPIGQAIALVVRERRASALLVDKLTSRLERGRATGAEVLELDDDLVSRARAWAGEPGPVVAFDATGEPAAVRAAVEMVSSAGRVVVVGISDKEVGLNIGWFTQKEIDVLGTSCCTGQQFAEAVAIVGRNRDVVERLITQQFGLEEAPAAIDFAMRNPAEVMKVVVRPTV
jgi:threonine dehydrogenase-like Zn-dependent dehydrogenase